MHKLQRITKLIAWNSHLALKVAITSRYDVTSVILTRDIRDIQDILLLLVQNYDKVVARRIITRVAARLHRRSVGTNDFLISANL